MIMSLLYAFSCPHQRLRRRAGNAILESALCFLLVMTIFIAIIEFGMGIFTYNFVSYAAREGSRYASTRGSLSASPATADSVQTMIRNQVVALDSNQLSVTTTWNPNNTAGNTVTVNVSYPITPLLGFVLGNITVGATSTMMIAQ
jgi:Flp pilus assembly protein TadG